MSGLMISFLYDYIYTVYVTLTALLFYCGHAGMEKVTLKLEEVKSYVEEKIQF